MADADNDPMVTQAEGLLVATADRGDAALDDNVQQVLALLRNKLAMDVMFVSKFEDGLRTFRMVDQAPGAPAIDVGDSGPLESSWCHRIVSGRLP